MRHAYWWTVLICGVFFHANAFAENVAEVVGLKGEAVMLSAGKMTSLTVGASVEEGAEVRTANPGRIKLRFPDGSIIVVGDASTLKIEKFHAGNKESPRVGRFVLDIGLISQTVAPSKKGSWVVRTPSAVTAVRGTQYIIEVKPDLETEVNVQSGAVTVEPMGRRMRGFIGGAGIKNPQPILLDQQSHGTTCSTAVGCRMTEKANDDRLRALTDRLSGV